MNRRARIFGGLGLITVAVLASDHPAMAAAALVVGGLAALVLSTRRRRREAAGRAAAPWRPDRIERLLVPVDFSPESALALDYARTLAGRFRSQVFVLHVVPPPRGLPARWSAEEAREARWRARVGMQAFLSASGGHGGCQVVFTTGTPFAAVLDEARRLKVNLIVLGCRGAGQAEASGLGRTAAEVVRRADVPVLSIAGLPEALDKKSERAAVAAT